MEGEQVYRVARTPSQMRSGFLFLLLTSLLLCSSLLKADPTQGPGGPVLVVTSADSLYGTYYAEILRTEGFNLFAVEDIAAVTPALLSAYDLVVLAEMPLTPSQVTVFTDWVTAGGQLIAMDPDPDLAGLLGLAPAGGQISEGYLLVDGASPVGAGVVNETMQFHGTASLFALNGAQSLATLYSSANTASTFPAATLNAVGSNGGQAAAFAFDLATSIVYTRQGNPAWEGQNRDGSPPIRANDLFYGASATDPQPDWVDLSKVAIPQADEQQRFLANLIIEMTRARQPLPRFWYFPRGERAVVVLTGDDHGVLTPGDVLDRLEQLSPAGCAVEDWECLRMSLYVYPSTNLTDAEAAAYVSNGFEVGSHVDTGCADYDAASLDGFLAGDLGSFAGIYPSIPAPVSTRYHCIAWSDWATGAKGALDYGIRFDTNYYYWPPGWVNDTPGHFTGSAMPMRFADLDGTLIDVFQAVTQMTDESGQSYPETIDTLLDRALGAEQQFGAYTVNAHTDGIFPAIHEAIAQSALARNVSVVTSRQMLEWLDGRNDSFFDNLTWDGTTLGFTVTAASAARGLEAMIPYRSDDGVLVSVSRDGQDQSFQVATIKGIAYARAAVDGGGAFTAVYDPNAVPGDIEAPVITDRTPAPGATSVDPTVVLTTTFNEALDPATVSGNTFELRDASGSLVPATVSYDPSTFTASLTPSVALDQGNQYTATLRGGLSDPRITDLAGNALAGDSTWAFTTIDVVGGYVCPCSVWGDSVTPGVASASDPGSVELGVKFRPLVDGFVTGVRFYKGSGNTGTHVGNLWAQDGTLLARATFGNETSSGWQTVFFDTPVAVTAGSVYVASYFAPNGGYAIDANFFASSVSSGPLELLADGDVGGNGVYNYGPSSAFPNQTWNASNYWVDVVFTDDVGPDTTAPEVVDQSPAPGATGVNFSPAVTASFSEDLDPATVDASSFELRDGGGNVLSAGVSYDGATRTAVLVADSLLLPSSVYTVTLVGGASGLADLAGNALADDVSWSFTTQSVDTTAPTVTSQTPVPGATGVALTVAVTAVFDEPLDPASVNSTTFELRDAGGTPVTAAISYDDITRTAVLSPSLQLLPSTVYTATLQGGAGSSITDAVGNPLAADVSWSFTTRDPGGCPCSVWDDATVPGNITEQDPSSVELGMKFTTSVDGFVTGVRFYKGPQNTGTHEGRLWALDGTLLAEVTFTNESASGWQEAAFAEPVAVTAGTVYVVSYRAPNGFYSGDNGYFATTGVTNGPLRALQDGENGGNGVYLYGNGGFPDQSWQASNYWVDVVFTDNTGPGDITPPSVTGQAPEPGEVGVATDVLVTASFSESLGASAVSESTFELRDSAGVLIPSIVAYDEGTRTATLTPSAPLAPGETFTALLQGGETEPTVRDLAGNALAADVSWSFTTVAVDVTAPTVTAFAPSDGAIDVQSDTSALAAFSEALDPASVTTQTFLLTDEGGGPVPASVTWDEASLTAILDPLDPLAAGTTFTATLVGAPTNPAITDLAGNPLSNDVTWLFRTADAGDTTPPTVTSVTPTDGAVDVPVDVAVSATFDEDLDPATVSASTFELLVADSPVAATVSYDAATRIATAVPVASLPPGTSITVRVRGGTVDPRITDLAGNALVSDVTWTFTTGALASGCLANPITAENCLPGSPPGEWDINGVGDPTIQGFATDISVNQGETVEFKVDTDAAAYRFDIYRLGYYGGLGARQVASVLPTASLPQNQPVCLRDDPTGLIDCGNWSVSGAWDVPADAVSGVYIARLERQDNGGASHIVFVVRDDDSNADILFQTADTTWQAYNDYGGNSLYTGAPAGRAYKVSYNRPFVTRQVDGGQDWVFNAEYPMIRWLEANGYDVAYFTGVDSDRRGGQILNHSVFMSVGHDEYWSAAQRANVEAARDAGVHLAFFSGNEIFWKTRWEESIDTSGALYRTLVCYKETSADAKIDPEPLVWTGTWRDPRFSPPADGGRPENELTGQLFRVNAGFGGTESIVVPAEDGRLRFWRNTSIAALPPGSSATLPFGVLGYEWDVDVDNGFRPAGAIRMSSTTVNAGSVLQDFGDQYAPETVTHALTLYRAPSGALVFGSGTIQWSWGLDDQHDRAGTPTDSRMQQATVNLLADMSVQPATLQPGLLTASPSADTIPPTAVINTPADGAVVPVGNPLTVTGTATDTGGGVVGGVEVSTDGGATWRRAEGRDAWSYTFTPTVAGSLNIRVRASDDSANLETPDSGITVTVDVGGGG